MQLRPTTVRARLTLWYTLVLSAPLVAFAIVSFLIFQRALQSQTDAFLRDALAVFAREMVAERRAFPDLADAMRVTIQEVRFRDLDIVVLDEAGAVLALSAPVNLDAQTRHSFVGDSATILRALRRAHDAQPRPAALVGRRGSYRLFTRPLRVEQRGFILAGVYPLLEVEATLRRIRGLFLIAIPLFIAIAATGGYFLAKRSFTPVSTMAARAAEIGATTLHERLPIATEDELGALARVLNQLLDRLERSFAQQRRFMADASHELRTPTTIIRTEAEVTLSRESREEPEYRASMAIVQDAARRISRIVDDIFLLARADAGHLSPNADPLYLEDVVHDAVRAVRPLADPRHINIALLHVVEAPFTGDADLLGRVLLNLLDNAIRHSPDDARIDVDLRKTRASYEITVVDAGDGIPEEAHERVFERFFRLDVARSRAENVTTSGAGLGLSIGRRIAELHAGSLELVSSRPGRTEFRLSLPIRSEPNRLA
ncbi:MAG: sensor histidine kinase [Longimicrobiales bacterium]